eukprot:1138503-Pelagomonas_calceolata.AAC.7
MTTAIGQTSIKGGCIPRHTEASPLAAVQRAKLATSRNWAMATERKGKERGRKRPGKTLHTKAGYLP